MTALACGGDDSASDDGDDSADDGTTADAGDGGDDGADDGADDGNDDGADDGDGADAGAGGDGPLSGTFLLGIDAEVPILGSVIIRAIATIAHTPTEEGGTAGTADFSLQALFAPECTEQGESGTPAGEPFAVEGVAINEAGEFTFTVLNATIPAGAVSASCGMPLTADALDATGATFGEDGATCGEVTVMADLTIPGTFGTIRVEPGQVGDDNLPKPLTACPK